MIVRIDQKSEEPLYLQIRSQIIAAIARGELVPGTALPSVRSLASDLGINLHTVNKAYAVLRDEGYVLMRGRSGAYIADPCEEDRSDRAQIELAKMEDALFELALAHRRPRAHRCRLCAIHPGCAGGRSRQAPHRGRLRPCLRKGRVTRPWRETQPSSLRRCSPSPSRSCP